MRYYSTKNLLKRFPEIVVEDEGRWNVEDDENTYYVQIFSFLEENNIDKEDCPLEGEIQGHWARGKDDLREKVYICANFINEIKKTKDEGLDYHKLFNLDKINKED